MPCLSPQSIKAMPTPLTGNKVDWDTQERGLGIRITATGARAFVFRYVIAGREHRMTLGAWPALTLTAARDMARLRKGEVIGGANPLAAKKAARRTQLEGEALLLRSIVARYIAERVVPEQKPRTQLETRRALEQHWKPLHEVPIGNVTRALVAARLGELAQKSGPVAANRTRAQLSALYRWAIGEGLADSNPVTGTTKRKEKERERVLSNDELRVIWQATEGPGDYNAIVRLLMLTGQRREEVGGIERPEVDFNAPGGAEWTLPAARAKNGREHKVPLSDDARAVLEGVEHRLGRALLFGEGEGPFSGWSRCKERLDARIAAANAKAAGRKQPTAEDQPAAWTLHDLRRTLSTKICEDLDVLPHVVEAILNHVSGHKAGVAGVYNRAEYMRMKRVALDRWAAYLAALVAGEPSKVVPLRRAASA